MKDTIKAYDGTGEDGQDGIIGGRWYGQPEYVEVWVEKNDLIDNFETILKDKKITLRGNRGFSSLDFLRQCSEELKELMDRKGLEPGVVTIIYCGDWDPSGETMEGYMKIRLKQLGIVGINFERIAITKRQIDRFKFPLLPIEKGNPNNAEFSRVHGPKATHLNAFFTRRNYRFFKTLLLESVDSHFDQDIYDTMVDEYDVAADDPPEMTQQELDAAIESMKTQVSEAFREGWE